MPTVREITAAIASGDTEAFTCFYREWFDFVFTEARWAAGFRGRDEQFCLDVVQDAMMRVIRSIKPMDTDASVRAWLRVVTHSSCYDHLRKDRRRIAREAANSQPHSDATTDQFDERLAWLREQLAEVDSEIARMLHMRFRLGWTLQRIGAALGLKPGAVDGRIARTLAQLRERAQEKFHED